MNHFRLAALLTLVGVATVTLSQIRPHVYSFILFLCIGGPAILAGAVLFLFSHRKAKHRGA